MSSKSRYIRTFSIKMSSGTSQMESVPQDQKRCSSLSFWIKYGQISLASIIHILFILRCKDNIIFLNYQENLFPIKVFFPRCNLKVILGDAQVHARIANQRETFVGFHNVSIVLHADVFEGELLLVDRSGCE